MPPRSERIIQMNPSRFISSLKEFTESRHYNFDEVVIRRIISGLYFSLFIFWANKKYFLENRRSNGPNQDRFSFIEFVNDMIAKDLDAEIEFLHTYRIASDHYALNPTVVRYEGRAENLFGRRTDVEINKNSLKRAIQSAEVILEALLEDLKKS